MWTSWRQYLFCRAIWILCAIRKRAHMETVTFVMDDGQEVEFYVVEETRIHGRDYLLVADSEEGDAEAVILKDISEDGEEEAVFEMVEDEQELDSVAAIFEQLLDDIDIEK